MDGVFKVVTISAESELLGGMTSDARSDARHVASLLAPLFFAAFLAGLAWLAAPIARWERAEARGETSPSEIARAAQAIDRFPRFVAGLWSLGWVAFFGVVFVVGGGGAPLSGKLVFLIAMMLGPLPLAHGLAVWLVTPVGRRVWLLAREKNVLRDSVGHGGLRGRLAFYALATALAPTAYMASIAFAVRARSLPLEHVTTVVVVFFGGIAIFAILAAVLLAVTITGPVADMASIMRVITRQGDVRHVGRVPIGEHDEVGVLAELTNTMLDRLEIVARGQATASESLAALNQTLEKRIEERTAELRIRTADMRLVLDNVTQALFAIDGDGTISAERSSILERWFGPIEPGESFHHYLGRRSPAFGATAAFAWGQILDGDLPFEIAIDQLPAQLDADGRSYRLTYDRIDHRAALRILVVISDVTGEIEHAALVREKGETFVLLDHLIADRAGFIAFVDEASRRIEHLTVDDFVTAKRALHTVKGSAALFGLESVATICHDLESTIAERGTPPTVHDLAPLTARWERLVEVTDRLLGGREDTIVIAPERYRELDRALRDGATRTVLARMVHELTLDPVAPKLAQLAEQARRLGSSLGKEIAVTVEDDGLRVDGARWASLWSSVAHAVRNGVDHGIEDPGSRLAANKSPVGQIRFVARRRAEKIVLEIHDDGRGVSWDRVSACASALGLPTTTRRDLVRALFADGLSTASRVSETSGRGVGMAALREAVHALGGEIDITSEPGQGTTLRMTFPESAAAPDFEPVSSASGEHRASVARSA